MLETPTTNPAPKGQPMEYDKDFNNIDSLFSDINHQQQANEPVEKPIVNKTDQEIEENNIYDPIAENKSPVFIPADPQERERNGKRTAKLIDGLVSFSAATWAKADNRQEYQAKEDDLKDLGNAWADYTEDKPFNIPPWANLAGLYLITYGPVISKANNDRRIGELNNRVAALENDKKD